ncbi:hypothetical protein CMI38_03295 [Candidatus Pacearchaeota archaeon]|nr:hypothetical protein [Candidatus Pacearchaeota archaeon]
MRMNKKFGMLFVFVLLVGVGMVLGQSTYSGGYGGYDRSSNYNPWGFQSSGSNYNSNSPYSSNSFYDGNRNTNANNPSNNPLQRSDRDLRNDPFYNNNRQGNDPYNNRFSSNYNSQYPDYYNRQGNGYNTFGGSSLGNSYNPQFGAPRYSGFQYNNPAQYWSGYGSSQCIAGQDLILQIAPGGCSPPVVRSDLLEEQNVPVFCKVSAVQVNPLIDISRVRSLRFSGEYPEGISGVSYYPARAAIGGKQVFSESIVEDNLGYLVVVLSRQANEETMPDFLAGNVTAVVDYSSEGAFGIGDSSFYLNEISDGEWARDYRDYGFWNGKGYVRVESIDQNVVNVAIYNDFNSIAGKVSLREGQTSRDVHLNGFYCAAGMRVKVERIGFPVDSALLQVNDEQIWVAKGDRILNNRCRVVDLESDGAGGKVEVRCSGEDPLKLSLVPGKAVLSYDGNEFVDVKIGGRIGENTFLAYIGEDVDNKRYSVLVKDGSSSSESDFRGKDVSSVVRGSIDEGMNVEKIKKESKRAIDRHYKRKGLDSVEVSVVVEGKEGFGAKLDEVSIAKDRDFSADGLSDREVLGKEYYDRAISEYEQLAELYPNERREFVQDDSYAALGLLHSAQMSRNFHFDGKAHEFYTRLIREYPDSSAAQSARVENSNLLKYDTSNSAGSIRVFGVHYYVNLLDFKKPDSGSLSAVLVIDGEERVIGLNEISTINRDKFVHNFKVTRIDENYVDVEYEKSGDSLDRSVVRRKRLTTQNNQEVFEGINVRLQRINLNKQVKLTLLSGNYGSRTESSFNFGIGIEKRAIKINPELAKDAIASNLDSIRDIQNINDKLGTVVSGLKGACFATSAMLTLKSTLSGGADSLARGILMTNSGGWNEKCEQLVDDGVYSTVHQCLLDKSGEIDKDVGIYANEVERTNNIIRGLNEKHKEKEGGIFGDTRVNTNKVKEEYKGIFENWCKGQSGSVRLPGKDEVNVKLGEGDDSVCGWESLTHEQRRDIMTLRNSKNVGGSDVFGEVMNRDLGKTLLNAKNFHDENEDRIKSDEIAKDQNLGIKTTDPFGDSVTPGFIKTVTTSDSDHKVYGNFSKGDKLVRVFIPKEKTLSGGDVYKITDTAGNEGVLREIGGKQVMVEMVISSGDNYFVPKQDGRVYQIDGRKVSKEGSDEVRRYMSRVGMDKIKQSDKKAYENRMRHPDKLRVRYFERAPYTGLPSEVPFDIEDGWYVEMTYVLSGFGKPYDESGRVTNFYICNVGENGMIEFKQSADDVCRFYNVVNPDVSFPGLSGSESLRLVNEARQAIQDAARQHGKERVTINGHGFETGKSFGGEAGRCTDFMSVSDCTLMFNVCDPVICPASRCDYGGKYRVDNVIQSGIAGSLLLCLPNYKEGVGVPICLSGVHAGLDNYVSILNSTVQCLNESIETGRNIGICDEIKSIYLCEFFWRQAAPLTQVALPSLFGSGSHGGGEYLTTQTAWDNTQSAITYYRDVYATNSFQAFANRKSELAGTNYGGANICQGFVSGNFGLGGGSFVSALLEPDSPSQFSGWISEIPLSTATVPPTSHYKVYYHIFAGNDIGVQYSVYLKDLPNFAGVNSIGFQNVDSGYINRGSQVDEARDFVAASGFKQLCINVNGKEECGFGQVTTSYAINSLTEGFVAEQAKQKVISEKNCVAGTPNIGSLVTPNIQSGVEEFLNPQLYNQGIIRVCSSQNPGISVLPSGEYDTTNSKYSKWQEVGYCDDPLIKCWMDTDSVREVIRDEGLEQQVLDNVDLSRINSKGFWTYEESRGSGDLAEDGIRDLVISEEDDRVSIEDKIKEIEMVLRDLTDFGITNTHRARGHYLLGRLYTKIAEELWKKRSRGENIGDDFSVYASADEDFTYEEYLKGYGELPLGDGSEGSFKEDTGIGNEELDERYSSDSEEDFLAGESEIVNEGGGSFKEDTGIGNDELDSWEGVEGRGGGSGGKIESGYHLDGNKILAKGGEYTEYKINQGLKNADGSVRYRIYYDEPITFPSNILGRDSLAANVKNGRIVFVDDAKVNDHTNELNGLIFDGVRFFKGS